MQNETYLTTPEVAARFGVTRAAVTKWLKAGHLHGRRKGPGRTSGWLIPESEVRRLEAQLAGSAVSEPDFGELSRAVELTPADIDAASEAWDAAMPDFAGLLDAGQVGE